MPLQFEELEAALRVGDADLAALLAHRMKGAASVVGGVALQDVALAMELAGGTGDLREIQDKLRSSGSATTSFARCSSWKGWKSPHRPREWQRRQKKGRFGARNVGLGGALFVCCGVVSKVLGGTRLVEPKVFCGAPGAMGGSVP